MSRVLIVEDELLVARSMATLLGRHGHQVVATVATGGDAIAAARTHAPELVLMDVHLRGAVDGIEAARRIRHERDVPVVFLTAYADAEHLARAKETEPHGYLVKPYRDQDLLTTVEVVTHKHQRDRERDTGDRWLATTLQSLGEAVIGVDEQLRVRLINRTAEQLTGWTHAEAEGLLLADVLRLTGPGVDAQWRSLADTMADGLTRNLDSPAHLATRTGDERPIEGSVAAVVDERGQAIGGVVIVRDVSERRAREAQGALSARMASMASLTAGLGHKLNNPLTYNLVNLQLLRGSLLPRLRRLLEAAADPRLGAALGLVEDLDGAAADALDGAERMRDILATIRSFARPEGATDQVVDVAAAVEAALKITTNELRQRAPVQLDLRAHPSVLGHLGQLTQVFTHLLVNAAQAVPAGGTHGRPFRVTVDRDGDQAVVSISDPGEGISPENMARIFEPFFTTRPLGHGAGLGLAIVHAAVTAHGGHVAVTSKLGTGSTFRVTLPCTACEVVAPPQPAVTATPTRRKVLVVDDDARVGRTLGRMLDGDHAVTVVSSGQEALARLGTESFDALLVDVMMPEMTGAELYAILERDHPEQARRVLFVTGGAFTIETQAFVAAQADRTLSKPVRPDELRAAIERLTGPR